MKRNTKYWVHFIIIILLVVGFKVQANNSDPIACTMDAKLCPDGVTYVGRSGPKCEFQACPGEKKREEVKNRLENFKKERELNKEENKIKRDEFKNEREGLKDDFKNQKEQQKNKIESMIQSVKTEREKFKAEFELKKEEVKTKVEEMKTKLKEDLTKIKDEKKRISSEKILEAIQKLNIKLTDNLSEKINKIENVLVGIQSRISKAEERGLDVTKVKVEVEKAKIAITKAREAISIQASKVYNVNITTESNLRAEMKKLRDLFRADMKIVYEKVKLAHIAVKNTATTLAQIPQIDDDNKIINEEDSIRVEDNSETTKTN